MTDKTIALKVYMFYGQDVHAVTADMFDFRLGTEYCLAAYTEWAIEKLDFYFNGNLLGNINLEPLLRYLFKTEQAEVIK